MPEKADEYDLPPLTFALAAKAVGVTEGQFIEWILVAVKPSPQRWSEWRLGKRPLPERLVRRYLTDHAGARPAIPPDQLSDDAVVALARARWGADVAEALTTLIAGAERPQRAKRKGSR